MKTRSLMYVLLNTLILSMIIASIFISNVAVTYAQKTSNGNV